MFIDLSVKFLLHRFLQLWTSSQTFINFYAVSHPTKDLPKTIQCYAIKWRERNGTLKPLKGVTKCAYTWCFENIYNNQKYLPPWYNSPVCNFYKQWATFQVVLAFMNSQNTSPSPSLEHPLNSVHINSNIIQGSNVILFNSSFVVSTICTRRNSLIVSFTVW